LTTASVATDVISSANITSALGRIEAATTDADRLAALNLTGTPNTTVVAYATDKKAAIVVCLKKADQAYEM